MNARLNAQRLGRFTLLRELGRGAQATVWLAHDPRLDREVALKRLDAGGNELALDEWLHEARAVSRLAHPHIVPVFEADEAEGQPYLVFEYVAGPTLTAHLRGRGGALPAREAAALMLGVLDALAAAHDRGIVHRDLKPSNILLGADGRPRVMDFGIAARMDGADAGTICGTPGYISPEAARGAAPQPAMDVFAAGVMLAEMLGGQRLLHERDPMRALERVQREDLAAPVVAPDGSAIDPALQAIAARAIARKSEARYASAAALRDALARWLGATGDAASAEASAEPSGAAAGHATLEFLLRRMKHRSDFPALSDSVVRIERVANAEHENLSTLADAILEDVALTNKLLRVVNSAHYGAAGGAVSTVSRAVALVGFAGIRNMALSLVLLERMPDRRHAEQLKEEYLRALMAATLAQSLCAAPREAEETFLGAMFQNLGRLLVEFYFPEEAAQMRASGSDIAAAAPRVLGIGLAELGAGVARAWGLPDTLQRAMRAPEGDAPAKPLPASGLDRQRWLGRMAADAADAMLAAADGQSPRLDVVADRYGRALGIDAAQLKDAAEAARQRLAELARAMQMQLASRARARRLMAAAVAPEADTLDHHTLRATEPAPLDATLPSTPKADTEMLAQGVQDITAHMAGDQFKLNEVLRMVLETMYRALGLRRIVFALRDPRSNTLTGRFGLGEGAAEFAKRLQVPLAPRAGSATDLFAAVCLKGADTLIADAAQGAIAQRLPAWFTGEARGECFVLLPLMLKGAPFALIYAEGKKRGAIELGEKELALLRTLRNQAVMAFRQVG